MDRETRKATNWSSEASSFEELAASQGVCPVTEFETLLGHPSAEDNPSTTSQPCFGRGAGGRWNATGQRSEGQSWRNISLGMSCFPQAGNYAPNGRRSPGRAAERGVRFKLRMRGSPPSAAATSVNHSNDFDAGAVSRKTTRYGNLPRTILRVPNS